MANRPNGAALAIANHGAVSVLAVLEDDNYYGQLIQEYPHLGLNNFYITKLEASGQLKKTDAMKFKQWVDGNKPYENFKVTTAVTGASAGAPVTVTLTTDSHLAGGTLSPLPVGHILTEDVSGLEYVIVSKVTTTAGGHTAVVKPADITKIAELTTASVFLWNGRAGNAGEASDQLEGMYQGYTQRERELSVIRTDKAYTDFASLEAIKSYLPDGSTYYDLDKSDLAERHLYTTEQTLMFGQAKTNMAGVADARNTNAEGLIPQIKKFGENLGTNVTIDKAFYKALSRTAVSNGTSVNFDILTDQEFIMANEDFLTSALSSAGIAQQVTRNGLTPLEVAFGFSTYEMYNLRFNVKRYDLLNTQRTHGSDVANSHLKGTALFIPQGTAIHPDAGALPFLQVRYMSDGDWINKLSSDGGFLKDGGKNTKMEARYSITSYKGLETFNIGAFKYVKVNTTA